METKTPLLMAAMTGVAIITAQGESLRPLGTDRPDTTESPYTVDAGRYQLEVEIAALRKDGSTKSFGFGELNVKYGVDTDTDIQFVLPLYEHVEGGAGGFGDMQVRVKRNLWGNDGGGTALAIMPFVQLPTGMNRIGSGEFEGGVIVPFGFEGAGGWSYGLQAEVDLVADENRRGHHFSFLGSATAAHGVTENTGMFFEMVAIRGEGGKAGVEHYFNTGLTWAVTETLQFDGGVRVGLSNDAEDFSPFVGVSVKF